MTILVGYAPSKAADAALDTALDITRSTGEHVVVVNAGPGGEHRTKSLVTEEQQRGVQARLDASGVTAEFRQYARGRSTVEEMKDVAAELDPSIVVIGACPRPSRWQSGVGSHPSIPGTRRSSAERSRRASVLVVLTAARDGVVEGAVRVGAGAAAPSGLVRRRGLRRLLGLLRAPLGERLLARAGEFAVALHRRHRAGVQAGVVAHAGQRCGEGVRAWIGAVDARQRRGARARLAGRHPGAVRARLTRPVATAGLRVGAFGGG